MGQNTQADLGGKLELDIPDAGKNLATVLAADAELSGAGEIDGVEIEIPASRHVASVITPGNSKPVVGYDMNPQRPVQGVENRVWNEEMIGLGQRTAPEVQLKLGNGTALGDFGMDGTGLPGRASQKTPWSMAGGFVDSALETPRIEMVGTGGAKLGSGEDLANVILDGQGKGKITMSDYQMVPLKNTFLPSGDTGVSDGIIKTSIDDQQNNLPDTYGKSVHPGRQGKHIMGDNNYIEGRSVLYGTVEDAQRLVSGSAGKGVKLTGNKERVDFGMVIGKYCDLNTGEMIETTVGIIHYSKSGLHLVPARP